MRVATIIRSGIADQRLEAATDGAAAAVLAVAAASGILGFVYGDVIVSALSYSWNTVILPAFMTVYLSGLALCG